MSSELNANARPPQTLMIVVSLHHQNTRRVAQAIADVLQARIVAPEQVAATDLAAHDLVGFGSGIYFGRFHRSLRHWISQLSPSSEHPAAFLFSTAGLSSLRALWHWPLRKALTAKGFDVLADFCCRGYDTVGPLALIGGLNRGHPDARDLARAAEFAGAVARQWDQDVKR
jgi:flavodoxin